MPKIKLSPIPFWEHDLHFNNIYNSISKFTVASKKRCYILYEFLNHIKILPGDIAEVGVYKGGTAYLINEVLSKTEKHIFLFDTFSGSPKADREKDPYYFKNNGKFSDTSFDSVKKIFSENKKVVIVKGKFSETCLLYTSDAADE